MLKPFIIATAVAFSSTAIAAELNTLEQKSSYFLGAKTANEFQKNGLDIDLKAFMQGMEDILAGKEMQLSQTQIQDMMKQMEKRQMEKMQTIADENAKAGKAFLAENAKKKGVVTTQSGLQYKVLTEGKGDSPKATDKVIAHYEGRLINGEVFDSSFQRGTPAEFGLNQVIKGWQEALQLMKVGSKWEIYVPAELGYGSRGAPPRITPNSTLIFTVELMSFVPSK